MAELAHISQMHYRQKCLLKRKLVSVKPHFMSGCYFSCLGGVKLGYDHFLQPKVHSAVGAVIGHGYTSHDFTVGGKNFAVSFDKSAEVRQVDANSTIMSGNELSGNTRVLVNLVDLSATPTFTLTSPPSCNAVFEEGTYTVIQNVSILGSSYPLCGANADPSDENAQQNCIVGTEFETGGQWYKLVFTMPSVSQAVDINTAAKVVQSIST